MADEKTKDEKGGTSDVLGRTGNATGTNAPAESVARAFPLVLAGIVWWIAAQFMSHPPECDGTILESMSAVRLGSQRSGFSFGWAADGDRRRGKNIAALFIVAVSGPRPGMSALGSFSAIAEVNTTAFLPPSCAGAFSASHSVFSLPSRYRPLSNETNGCASPPASVAPAACAPDAAMTSAPAHAVAPSADCQSRDARRMPEEPQAFALTV